MPATASDMNYISAVYGFIVVVIAVDWMLRGRKQYHRPEVIKIISEVASPK
jgi:choline transport protein